MSKWVHLWTESSGRQASEGKILVCKISDECRYEECEGESQIAFIAENGS